MTRPLLLVTAAVDKMALKKPISVDVDLKMVGAVIWVGRSSIEIQLEVTQPTNGILPRINCLWKNLAAFQRFILTCFHIPYGFLK